MRIVERLGVDWPVQKVHFSVPRADLPDRLDATVVEDNQGSIHACQIEVPDSSVTHPGPPSGARVWVSFFIGLPAWSTREFRVIPGEADPPDPSFTLVQDPEGVVELSSARFGIRLAAGERPIRGLRAPDGTWFGMGKLRAGSPLSGSQMTVQADGPIEKRLKLSYSFRNGGSYDLTLSLAAGSDCLSVYEEFQGIDGELRIDFGPEFVPASALWRVHSPSKRKCREGEPPNNFFLRSYALDYREPDSLELQPFFSWERDVSVFWCGYDSSGTVDCALMIGATHSSRWRQGESGEPGEMPGWHHRHDGNPKPVPIRPRVETGGGTDTEELAIVYPLLSGTRQTILCTFENELAALGTALGIPGEEASYPEKVVVLNSKPNLDYYKDLVLDWEGMDRLAGPRLLVREEEIPAIRRKIRDWPWLSRVFAEHKDDDIGFDPSGAFLGCGEEAYAEKAFESISRFLETVLRRALTYGFSFHELVAIALTRPLRNAAIDFDLVSGSQTIYPGEKARLLRLFAFINQCIFDTDYWPPVETGFYRGSLNFHSDYYTCLGVVACLLEGHPERSRWMDYVGSEMTPEFESNMIYDGTWVEAPNYQAYSLSYFTLASAVFTNCGYPGLFTNPKYKATMRYMAGLQTPPDSRTGVAMLPTVGDTAAHYGSQSFQAVFAWAAKTSRERDPEFSAEMMAAWVRAGSPMISYLDVIMNATWKYALALVDPALPVKETVPRPSARLPGMGAILRNTRDNRESGYLLFKMGEVTAHYDYDEGSIIWYSHGVPLLVDYGAQYFPSVDCSTYHNRVTVDQKAGYLDRGHIQSFETHPDYDYVEGTARISWLLEFPRWPDDVAARGWLPDPFEIPPTVWKRAIAYLKPADCLVIRDTVRGSLPAQWNLQVLAEGAFWHQNSFRFTCGEGMALSVRVLLPERPDLRIAHWSHKGFDDPRTGFSGQWRKVAWVTERPLGSMAERSHILRVHSEPDTEFLAVLSADQGTGQGVQASFSGTAIDIQKNGYRSKVVLGADGGLEVCTQNV